MRQHLRLAFFILLLCLSQKALTEVTDNVKVDLTGDVVFSPPLRMETPFANNLARLVCRFRYRRYRAGK